ncbi:uncharacterized protein LOC123892019 [Trifolium pratense]|nr:uncharacterized protein LOC123892019 [Trifolium pratense]
MREICKSCKRDVTSSLQFLRISTMVSSRRRRQGRTERKKIQNRTFSSSSPLYFFLFLFTVTVTRLHILLHNCRRRPPSPTTHLDIVFHKRMKKFFPVLSRDKASSSATVEATEIQHPSEGSKVVDYELLETDPGIKPPISNYHPDIQNEVRKAYLKIGRHKPPHNFAYTWSVQGSQRRRFSKNWFDLYDWIEYSESKDLAFCLPCFLFKNVSKYGGDHFVGDGFGDWKNAHRLAKHATSCNSHIDCVHMGYALMNPIQSVKAAFVKQTKQENADYRVRINTSLIAIKYLLRSAMPFRGNDEKHDSPFKGPFLELVETLKEANPEIASVLDRAPRNNYMTAPRIQKDLASACAYDFIFMLYMLVEILGFTNDLGVALQKRDQDLINALSLVNATKQELQEMREDGWEELISKVMKICIKHDIDVPDMDAPYRARKKPRQSTTSGVSNLHHYKHDCLFSVLDLQLHELNARFDEENTELLQCVSCLSPSSSFARFDAKKLLRMVEFYPNDFVDVPEVVLRHQLQTYVRDVREDKNFAKLKGLSDLCAKLVETNKCNTYNLVYKLLKLALVLPVATASVERVFSAMNLVKSLLCNKMSDEWLNNRLVTLIERDVLATIDNDVILDHFQQMDGRRFSL